jgi:hypothetical protein
MSDLIDTILHRLAERVPGLVSRPGDARYIAATSIWPRPIDRAPYAIIHCRTPEHVQWAIRAARHGQLPLSVRGGGHDWAGRSLCNGIVIDMRGMNGVAVGEDTRAALSLGGARTADVVAVTDPLGLAPVAGSSGAVGLAGLTLGGGYGALIGRFGLALDNLLAAEIVLADGRLIVTDHAREPELFWALRGGGGNFGVVTALRHRLHEVPSVRSGMLLYPFAEARAVMARCLDIAASAPDELTFQSGVIAGPDAKPAVMILPTWCGRAEEGEARLAPFLQLGTLLMGTLETMPYGRSLAMFDPFLADGRRTFMETCWLPALDTASLDVFIEAMETAPSPGCAVFTHEFKGAASRVPLDSTAFGLRRDHVLVEILASVAGPEDTAEAAERHRQWARATREAFEPYALPGGYPNLLPGDDAARAAQSYGPHAERLMRVKRRYDPDNVFSSAIPLPVSDAPPPIRP